MKDNDFYNARNSIYCYDNSDVLKNKLEIKSYKKLHDFERKIVLLKSYELRQNKIAGNFDVNHFKSIHKYLFENIYDFAGDFRNEDIAKDTFKFACFEYIEDELIRILDMLKNENYLKELDKEKLSKRLAYYLSEINVLHPFREGNGRVTREFIRQIAYNAGYNFDLKNTNPKDVLNACIKSVFDTTDLEKIIFDCLSEIK